MRTDDFDYHLPTVLIAQTPVEPRDASRLMVLDRTTGAIQHRQFPDLLEYLRPGDLMVFNQSRVIPARLRGRRRDTGGRAELLLLRREKPGVWEALGKPGRRLRPGSFVTVDSPPGSPALEVEVLESRAEGLKRVRLSSEENVDLLGDVPLPPYIHQQPHDPERYQTVYAREPGSVAAPTAGLHFTPELLDRLTLAGVEKTFVTLHIGLDTFRPVQDDNPADHHIHTEYYEVSQESADRLDRAKQEGRRIIAVGTTSARVLEQLGLDLEKTGRAELAPVTGQADIFILPGHRFRLMDALVTNFHLPRSTLLMLASAFAGRELILNAYEEAVSQGYRFYSFGDAMFLT